jgi:ADP-heptose:LPS heptosyltransferase
MLLHDDPRFASKDYFVYEHLPPEKHAEAVFERWKKREEELKPDRVINLWRTLESACIAEEYQPEFHVNATERRRIFGGKSFYAAVFERCGIVPPEKPKLDCLYYHPHEIQWGEEFRKQNEGNFVVFVPVMGTGSHKIIPAMKDITLRILEEYPAAVVYLAAEAGYKDYLWKHERIRHIPIDRIPVKQGMLIPKYADIAIGPETGLMVAAGMWGTPKVILGTASSIYQMTKYQENDYSIQSAWPCSPCHRSIYQFTDCEAMRIVGADPDGEELAYPECIHHFDPDYILSVVDEVFNERFIYNR